MMSHSDSRRRRLAQSRLYGVVTALGDLGDLILENAFRVTDQVATACWATRQSDGRTMILVSDKLALTLPDDELQVLILHELWHAAGANNKYHFRDPFKLQKTENDLDSRERWARLHHTAANLALDIALEQAMGFQRKEVQWALDRLRQRLILDGLRASRSKRTLPLAKAIPVLTCRNPWRIRLPVAVKRVHEYLHDRRSKPILPEAAYQAVLPLLKQLDAKTPGGLPGPQVITIPSSDGSTDEVFNVRSTKASAAGSSQKELTTNDLVGSFKRLLLSLSPSSSLRKLISPPRSLQNDPSLQRLRRHLTTELAQRLATSESWGNRQRDTITMLPFVQRPTNHEIRSLLLLPSSIPRLHENIISSPIMTTKPDVAIFIDSSGSMRVAADVVHGVLKELIDLLPELPEKIWSFDGQVSSEPLTVQMICDGLRYEGFSTNFDATVAFAIKNRLRQILLFTDGEGTFSEETLREAKAHGVSIHGVIFETEDSIRPSDHQKAWTTRFIWPL